MNVDELNANRWSQTFIWNKRRENLHCLRPHCAKMLLAKRILDDVREKWRSKKASGGANIVSPHSLRASSLIWAREASCARTRERALKPRGAEGPFSTLPPALASPLACLSRVYFSQYPPNGELARRLVSNLWWNSWTISALIGATNGNRPHSTRSAHWPKYNFISNSLEQGCGRQRYPSRQRKNAGMSRVQRNSEKYSIWLSRASRKTIPLMT